MHWLKITNCSYVAMAISSRKGRFRMANISQTELLGMQSCIPDKKQPHETHLILIVKRVQTKISYFHWQFNAMSNLLYLLVYEPILITERTFIHHLFNSAMLSLWKTGCEPCVAWKHMWDEIGDEYKKMGDNTVHGALKQKSSKGICQEIKAQTSWRGEDSDAQTYTVFFSDLEVEERSSNKNST